MMGVTHITAGLGLVLLGAKSYPDLLDISQASLAMAAVGSLLPDIDEPESWIGRRLFLLALPFKVLFGHRGFTHSLVALVAFGALAYYLAEAGTFAWLTPAAAAAFCIGYAGHLAADFLSNSGIPLLWPAKLRLKLPLGISTGGVSEVLVLVPLAFFVGQALWGEISTGGIPLPTGQSFYAHNSQSVTDMASGISSGTGDLFERLGVSEMVEDLAAKVREYL